MSQDWIEEAHKEIEEYFENASDEQIEKDLEEAGYSFYEDQNYRNILNFNELEHTGRIFMGKTTNSTHS